jgi:hypothetical protein
MRKIIIIHKEDIKNHIKKFDEEFNIEDPNIYDLNIKREDIDESEFIFYIYKNDENPNKIKGKILKAKHGDNHYDDLISFLLDDKM